MKTIIIIQARMGSSRLPGKVLMPLGDTVVLDYVVSRCKKIDNVADVIVATSTLDQDDPIANWCMNYQVACFRGSEDDVLSRYVECARHYQPDYVIRVTADCPFVDYHLANQIIDTMQMNPSDIHIIKGDLPRGLVVEMISYGALEYMHVHGKEHRHREHVTYYAYEFPEKFTQTHFNIPEVLRHPQLRITLDTTEDYELCKIISDSFYGNILVNSNEVIQFLINNPEIAHINSHVKQKSVF